MPPRKLNEILGFGKVNNLVLCSLLYLRNPYFSEVMYTEIELYDTKQ